MRDRNGKKILVGNKVKWYDPQEEYRDVNRVWEVSHIHDNGIILLCDVFGDAEVYPQELEVIE